MDAYNLRLVEPLPLQFGRYTSGTWRGKIGALAGSAAVHGAIAFAVIWAFYGFRYSAFNPALANDAHFIRPWHLIDADLGVQAPLIHALATLRTLPEAFLYGYAYVIDSAASRGAFLNGEYSSTGWWNFFPWTFLLKTTLPVLLSCAIVPLVLARRWCRQRATIRADLLAVAPLVMLFAVYAAFSMTSHLNIGQRHILPLYPVMFIAAGVIVAAARSWRSPLVLLVAGLTVWQMVDAVRIAPNCLAFFNPIAGGPTNGYRCLVDSSLDWGQDLPGLAAWLKTNVDTRTPVFLSYSGSGEPAYYDIRATPLMMLNGFKRPQPFVRLEPGVYCISVTSLQQVYNPVHANGTPQFEHAYQSLRVLEPTFLEQQRNPNERAKWEKSMPWARWEAVRRQYELLRFARLCMYLRARPPNAQIGYSINIYRVAADDLSAVLDGTSSQWQAAIERAASGTPPLAISHAAVQILARRLRRVSLVAGDSGGRRPCARRADDQNLRVYDV